MPGLPRVAKEPGVVKQPQAPGGSSSRLLVLGQASLDLVRAMIGHVTPEPIPNSIRAPDRCRTYCGFHGTRGALTFRILKGMLHESRTHIRDVLSHSAHTFNTLNLKSSSSPTSRELTCSLPSHSQVKGHDVFFHATSYVKRRTMLSHLALPGEGT